MLMYLRWLRPLSTIDLIYGGLDMPKTSCGASPVVHLPLCDDLLRATEAVATLKHTGNYVPLADRADLRADVTQAIKEVAYRDSVQGKAAGMARDVLARIDRAGPAGEAPASALLPLLHERIEGVATAEIGRRMASKARHALDHSQYLQAISVLWESILVTAAEQSGAQDPMLYSSRKAAQEVLEAGGFPGVTGDLRKCLDAVRQLRNAVVHGTPPRESAKLVRRALYDAESFQEVFEGGWAVLKALWNGAMGRSS
jgi:hypothetical protein